MIRYFVVEQPESSALTQIHTTAGIDRLIKITKAKELDSRMSEHQAVGDNKLVVRTPWLGATKWLERFAGANMTKLAEFTNKPLPRQHILTSVWNETGELFRECQAGLLDLRAREWDHILFWLKSTKQDIIDSKPMNVYLKKETVQTYSAYWQRFLCFLLLTTDDLSWRTETHCGFQLTDEQNEKVAELRMFYEFDRGTGEEKVLRRDLLVNISMEFIRQDVYAVGTPALVYFAGVLGYDNATQYHWPQRRRLCVCEGK
jgi:hypothetical protein